MNARRRSRRSRRGIAAETVEPSRPGSATARRVERRRARAIRLARVGRTLLRARILLSSYVALDLILFFRVDVSWLKLSFLGLALLGLGDALRLTLLASRKQSVPRIFAEVRDSGSEIAGYLATYLLPLLAAPNPDAGDIVGYLIYAVVIAIVTLRSDLAHINPTLYLLGWKVVTVVQENGDERYLICRHAPKGGQQVRVTQLYGILHDTNDLNHARTSRLGRT
jgi:hypothetical protein